MSWSIGRGELIMSVQRTRDSFVWVLKENNDFFWTWFTDDLDLGGWAHVCQLLMARLEGRVGTALGPRGRKVAGRWEGEGCSWCAQPSLFCLHLPSGLTITEVCSAMGTPKATSSSSPRTM